MQLGSVDGLVTGASSVKRPHPHEATGRLSLNCHANMVVMAIGV